MITQSEFCAKLHEASLDPLCRRQRPGQLAFNTLLNFAPRVAEAIRGTSYDPYYDDALLPAFWDMIAHELPE